MLRIVVGSWLGSNFDCLDGPSLSALADNTEGTVVDGNEGARTTGGRVLGASCGIRAVGAITGKVVAGATTGEDSTGAINGADAIGSANGASAMTGGKVGVTVATVTAVGADLLGLSRGGNGTGENIGADVTGAKAGRPVEGGVRGMLLSKVGITEEKSAKNEVGIGRVDAMDFALGTALVFWAGSIRSVRSAEGAGDS